MRFLAACFALNGGASVKLALKMADQLIEELDDDGIAAVAPKRTRKRNAS
jgi:hypothetical protein